MAGIPSSTLFGWVQRAKMGGMSKKRKRRQASRWSPEEKLRLLIKSSSLPDEELGVFLRKEGLHESDLEEFRSAVLAGLAPPKHSPGVSSDEKKIQSLERELNRKEKALAETAALLVLSKKYRAIMGGEDDDMGGQSGENS